MSLVSSLRFHDYQFAAQTSQGTWRWTTRMTTTGAVPTYSVIDIISPYGLLRDSIPLPGDIVTKMAEAIVELTQAFAPRILLGAGSITITLDEGRGFGTAQTVTVTNNGSYGSILGTSVASGAGYVTVSPASVSGLAVNESGSFQVNADSTTLLSTASPYSTQVTVQDSSATNSPQTISVNVIVRPKAQIAVTPDDLAFHASGPVGGPWAPVPPQTFQVINSGPGTSVLEYQVQKLLGNSAWLTSFSPSFGTLSGGAGHNITVNVAPISDSPPGTFMEYLRVSGYSSNQYQDVLVTLTIV